MVKELVETFARQIVRERMGRWSASHTDERALLAAAGEDYVGLLVSLEIDAKDNKFSFADFVSHGLKPSHFFKEFTPANPYNEEAIYYRISDPILMASFFATYRMPDEARAILKYRADAVQSYRRWSEAGTREYWADPDNPTIRMGRVIKDRLMDRVWSVPDFEELGLERVIMERRLDSFYLEGAFTPTSYNGRMKQAINAGTVEAFAAISGLKSRELPDVIRDAAYEQARSLVTSDKAGGFRYADIATFVRMCSPDQARELFNDARGVRQVAACMRSDAHKQHYIQGLRALAGMTDRKEVLERLGRGPTAEEILSVRRMGMATLLDEMDWSLVEPIHKSSGIRATALPYAEKLGPTFLRRFLTDHPERVKLKPNIQTEPAEAARAMMVNSHTSIADWEPVMEGLYQMYQRGRRVRDGLNVLTGHPAVSFIAMLKPYKSSSPDIDEMLKHHPFHDAIRELLDGYTPPNLRSLWGEAKE